MLIESEPAAAWASDLSPMAPTRVAGRDAAHGGSTFYLSSGAVFGRYRVREHLGSGGMGEVWTAHDPRLDREVALKRLFVDATDLAARRDARLQLQREAQTLAALSHPNIVDVYGVQDDDMGLALVMERVRGPTLKAWMQERRPWRGVVALFIAIAGGLSAAHAVGIIHRDFKPANVIVSHDDRPKVLDFGLARVAKALDARTGSRARALVGLEGNEHSSSLPSLCTEATLTGVVAGTPAYMAPEQHQAQAIDERSDQFAFCVALYEALYQQHPFREHVDRGQPWKRAVLLPPVLPPSGWAPRRLWRVLRRGLAADPSRRHPDMAALAHELERCLAPRVRTFKLVAPFAAALPLVWSGAEARDPCPASAEVQTAWNEQRSAGARAFARWNELGTSQWNRIEPELTEFVAHWRRAYDAACRNRTEAAVQDRDATMLCLQAVRQRLQATARVFAAAYRDTVLRGQGLVAELPDPERCGTGDVHRQYGSEGDDAWSRQAAYVEALTSAGSFRTALPLAEQLLEQTGPEAPSRRARALLVLGTLQAHLEQSERAVTTLEHAAFAAGQAESSRLYARTAVELTYHLGASLRRLEAAELWARHAESALSRVRDVELAVQLLNARATMAEGELDLERAHAYTRRALAILESHEHGALLARTLNNLGNVLFRMRRVEQADEAYARSYRMWQAVLGAEHPDVVMPLQNRAATFILRGDLNTAAALLEQVVVRWSAAYGSEHPKVALPLFNLAHIAQRRGDFAAAQRGFSRVLTIREAAHGPDHLETASAIEALGLVALRRGDWHQCRTYLERALTIYEAEFGVDNRTLGQALANLSTCFLPDDPAAAYRLALRAVELEQAAAEPDRRRLSEYLPHLGHALTALGRTNEALAVLRRALRLSESHDPNSLDTANARFALAQALLDAHPADSHVRTQALALARQAHDRFDRAHREQGWRREDLERIEAWLAREWS